MAARWLVAWVLSLATVVLDLEAGPMRLALAALPWLALAGLPSAVSARSRPGPMLGGALALVPWLFAARLDLAAGVAPPRVASAVLVALAAVVALASAAQHSARSPAARGAHAITWLVVVPGAPAALACAALTGAPPAFLERLASVSPLVWGSADPTAAAPWLGLAVLAVPSVLAARPPRPAAEPPWEKR